MLIASILHATAAGQAETASNINWWCSPDYVGKSKYDEWGNTDFSTRCTYRFLVDGSLVRTSTRDMITLAYVERDVAIRYQGAG